MTTASGDSSVASMHVMFDLWADASRGVVALAHTVEDGHELAATALEWNVREVFQHVVHIESVLLGRQINGAASYSFTSLTEYVNNGMSSLNEISFDVLRAELDALHEIRPAYLSELPGSVLETPSERAHWIEIAKDRVIDLWVHSVDLSGALSRSVDFHSPAAAYVFRYLVDGVPRVQGDLVQLGITDLRITGRPSPVSISFAAAPPEDRTTLVVSMESFVTLSTGRATAAAAHTIMGPADVPVHHLLTAMNQFKSKKDGSMSTTLDYSSLDARVDRLSRSPHARPEDMDMLRQARLDSPEALAPIVSVYESAYEKMSAAPQ